MFTLSETPLDPAALAASLRDPAAGALVTFEGWVRDHNDGRTVQALTYEAYRELAEKEGNRIVEEVRAAFSVRQLRCVHRIGQLEVGDCAVWVGVAAGHRGAAFEACRALIDRVKARVPIWKHELYVAGPAVWTANTPDFSASIPPSRP